MFDKWIDRTQMPVIYRMGNSTLHIQTRFVAIVAAVGFALLVLVYVIAPSRGYHSENTIHDHYNGHPRDISKSLKYFWESKTPKLYNSTYPMSVPEVTELGVRYRIAVISDLDTASKVKGVDNKWVSYLKKGYLTFDVARDYVAIDWDKDIVTLESTLSDRGRGMELSELIVFNGKLYTIDDRTGVIYEISGNLTIPWVILADGDGRTDKGFKCEWAAVKDQKLYIGGLGKEWTTIDGKVLNHNPQWIKIISPTGEVEHQIWRQRYKSLLKAAQIEYPGYLVHEAAAWSNINHQWFFLPRRASHLLYNEKDDEKRGTNLLLRASEDFSFVNLNTIGKVIPTRGFSSFKFIPETSDMWIIALKSEEIEGKISTYLTVFTVTGKILLPEHEIGKYKFEGIEFI